MATATILLCFVRFRRYILVFQLRHLYDSKSVSGKIGLGGQISVQTRKIVF